MRGSMRGIDPIVFENSVNVRFPHKRSVDLAPGDNTVAVRDGTVVRAQPRGSCWGTCGKKSGCNFTIGRQILGKSSLYTDPNNNNMSNLIITGSPA